MYKNSGSKSAKIRKPPKAASLLAVSLPILRKTRKKLMHLAKRLPKLKRTDRMPKPNPTSSTL